MSSQLSLVILDTTLSVKDKSKSQFSKASVSPSLNCLHKPLKSSPDIREKAKDKKQAINDMLNIKDYRQFLAESGWEDKVNSLK